MNDFYITTEQLRKEYGFGRDGARALIKKVRNEWEGKGYTLPAKMVAPRKAVLEALGVV